MDQRDTSMSTPTGVSITRGSVELINSRNKREKTVINFDMIPIRGTTAAEVRQNFRYERLKKWDERVKARETEAAGLVRLINIEVVKLMGLDAMERPAPRNIDEEFI